MRSVMLVRLGGLAAVILAGCGGGGELSDAVPDATALDARTGNASLAALSVDVGVLTPPFEPDVTEYDLDLLLVEDLVAFSPTAAVEPGTAVTVDGDVVASGDASPSLAFEPGTRDVDILVTAADGDAQTYRIHVHRGVDALASLVPSDGVLTPSFDTAVGAYELALPIGSETMTWTPSLLTPGRATIMVTSPSGTVAASDPVALSAGDNALTIVVAPHTRPPASYAVAVFRGTNGLASIELRYREAALSRRITPTFAPGEFVYDAAVGPVNEIEIVVSPMSDGASISVAGGPVAAGVPSPSIPVTQGVTTMVPIVVQSADGATQTYTVRVARLNGPTFDAYVKASNAAGGDQFGYRIAMWGDTIAVSAVDEDSGAVGVGGDQTDESAFRSGAVYVLTRSSTGWTQQAYIKPSNTNTDDGFGSSVALWGDTLVVGAVGEDSAGTGTTASPGDNSAQGAGAVYVFSRTGTSWTQQAYLKASNTGAGDGFGRSVALWGDTLVVSSEFEDSAATGVDGDQASNAADAAGAAYVFTRTGTTWTQQAYLKASNAATGDRFGHAVTLWNDSLAVSAVSEDSVATGVDGDQTSNTASGAGAVYVFSRSGSTWSQQAYVKASNTAAAAYFGGSISLWGDRLAVGAPNESSPTYQTGAVYVFARTGSTWAQERYLKASNQGAADWFGTSVSLCADRLAVGAIGEDGAGTGLNGDSSNNDGSASGAVYLYSRGPSGWGGGTYYKAPTNGPNEYFGDPVSLWGDTLVTSAVFEDSAATGVGGNQADNTATNAGAVYVYR